MIIKSMSRKEPSFGQLIEYMSDIDKSDEKYNIYQNIYSNRTQDIEKEFQQNAKIMFKRKNGVYLYHEILSITKSKNLDDQKQKEILRLIAYEYAQKRAEQNLVFATLHDDHDNHLHYHFIISANALGESKKTRMSKVQFDKFKKDLETTTLAKYPELEQKIVINKQAEEKLSNKGAERKRRTGKTPQLDILKEKLEHIFSNSSNKQEFFDALKELGFEIYVRGKTIGIVDKENNRKHRLKTIGMLDKFEAMSKRINLHETSKVKEEKTAETKTEKPKQEEKEPENIINDDVLSDKQKSELKHKDEMEKIRKNQKNKQSRQTDKQ